MRRRTVNRLNKFDSTGHPIDPRKWFEDSDGNLRAPVVLAQTGVLEYTYKDDAGNEVTTREAKLPEELLTKAVLFSAEGKPVTREHPHDMVDGSNYFKYQKGAFINPKIVGDSIHGEVVIYDPELKREIRDGSRYQVSPGFWSTTDFTGGALNGEVYDAAQRDIEINHIAIVKEGRAGDAVRVKLDSKEFVTMKNQIKGGKSGVKDADEMTPEEKQKKIAEYEDAINELRDANAAMPKEGQDAEDVEQGDPKPPEDVKPGSDAEGVEPDGDEPAGYAELPESWQALFKQLMEENARLKSESRDSKQSQQSFGKYLEARDTALKLCAKKQLNPNHDSADYYKRAVVEETGLPAAKLRGAMLDAAYEVAKRAVISVRKARTEIFDSASEHKTYLQEALEKSAKSNDAFSGKRKVGA